MSKQYKVAVVGATGAVGEAMLVDPGRAQLPGRRAGAAGQRALGRRQGRRSAATMWWCRTLTTFDLAGVDIALFSAGGSVSKEYAPKFAAAGAVVIDNSSQLPLRRRRAAGGPRGEPGAVRNAPRAASSPIPNCSTIQMVVGAEADPRRGRASSASTWRPTSRCPAPAAKRMEELAGRPRRCSTCRSRRRRRSSDADRVQRHPAHRRVPGQRLHQGRDEDGVGDAQDPGRRRHPW